MPFADVAAVTAITTKAYDSRGQLDISVAGKAWAIPSQMGPITDGQLLIMLQSKNQALQLQRILIPSS